MATIYIGSARVDERGKYFGGSVGDQKQKSSTNDLIGEVSMQPMYIHSKGWYIYRPKKVEIANALASAMFISCNNKNLGYDQYNRLGVIKYGIDTNTKTECDCSSLVRACIIKATGKDIGNFTTTNECNYLDKSGLFEKKVSYVSQTKTPVYNGDILVTKTKGHTVIVVSGNPRPKFLSNNSSSNGSNKYMYNGIDYSVVFEPNYYINKYSDLKNAFGTDITKLFNHFCTYGMKEGRQAIESFNVQAYKNRYLDLQNAFGNDLPTYYQHYIVCGKNEGRIAI